MCQGQEMSGEELQQEARDALKGLTQKKAAEQLGLKRSSVTVALNTDTPSRYAATLIRILENFTDYNIEKQVRYVARKK